MIRKAFKMRPCTCCGDLKGISMYSPTKSPFFIDGYLPVCNECLDKEIQQMKGEWAYMDLVCQWADAPFVPEQFTKIYASVPDKAVSTYLKYFSQDEYSRIHWETYQEKWKKAVDENNEAVLHPIFNQQEIDRLHHDWGESYSVEELYRLEEYYQDLKKSYGISDPATEKDARFLSKLSIEIDKNIANGAVGVEKLITAYNKTKESGGFTPSNASGANEFSSISELGMYMEKAGWTKKYHNDETYDIVDNTMKNVQGYVTRLYQNESTIADQIEDRMQVKRRIEQLEQQSFEDQLDIFENEAIELKEHDAFDPGVD